jgi:predicted MFS family arabinose efflux permease
MNPLPPFDAASHIRGGWSGGAMQRRYATPADRSAVGPVRASLAALSANLVGIGIARFGYTPLLPAIIGAGWFAPSAAAYLGAANLAGYLAGALGAWAVAVRCGAVATLRAAMLLTAASLFACAWRGGFAWFSLWRFVSGATGGTLMALAAPTVIAAMPAERRGIAGGVVFAGVGLGIAASGTLVPLLIGLGLVETWIGLGTAALLLTVFSWTGWPTGAGTAPRARRSPEGARSATALRGLYLEYALNAIGLVPHMVFLVDFIARGLGRGLQIGALCWVVFGAGAVAGPLIAGHLGDRIGFRATLRCALAIEAAAVALPLMTGAIPALLLSSLAVGASVPGIVAITVGRTGELVRSDPAAQAAAWSYCTTAFAIGQAVAGYGFSYLFAVTANPYPLLFAVAIAAFIAALAIDVAVNRRRAEVPPGDGLG